MKILKTPGKTASKQINILADVVMETSVIRFWLMSYEKRIDFEFKMK